MRVYVALAAAGIVALSTPAGAQVVRRAPSTPGDRIRLTLNGGEQSSAREGSVPIEAPVTKWFEVREGLRVAGRNAQVAGDGPDGRATNGG